MYYKEFDDNKDVFMTRYKELLTEEEMDENRPDWDAMGLSAPEDEEDFKWVDIYLTKSHIYAITGEDDYAMIWTPADLLVVDMSVKEAVLKIWGINLDM